MVSTVEEPISIEPPSEIILTGSITECRNDIQRLPYFGISNASRYTICRRIIGNAVSGAPVTWRATFLFRRNCTPIWTIQCFKPDSRSYRINRIICHRIAVISPLEKCSRLTRIICEYRNGIFRSNIHHLNIIGHVRSRDIIWAETLRHSTSQGIVPRVHYIVRIISLSDKYSMILARRAVTKHHQRITGRSICCSSIQA